MRKVSRLDFALVPARALRAAAAANHIYLQQLRVPPKYGSVRYFAQVWRTDDPVHALPIVVARVDMFETPRARDRVDTVGNDLVELQAADWATPVVMVLASELGRMVAIGPPTPTCPFLTVMNCHPVYD
jgi:hypothetical protein